MNPLMPIKRFLYKKGFRPRLGSLWYSPSLAAMYAGQAMSRNFLAGVTGSDPDPKDMLEEAVWRSNGWSETKDLREFLESPENEDLKKALGPLIGYYEREDDGKSDDN